MPCRILIADDDPDLRDLFRNAILRLEPSWSVEVAEDGREALDLLSKSHFNIAVLDYQMPHLNGLEVLKEIRQRDIQTDVILMTGHGEVDLAVQAMKEGARDFIQKPINLPNFITTLRALLETRHLPSHVVAARLDAFLKEHASAPLLTLNDLCRHFSIKRSYASRLFQENFHMSFRKRRAYHRVQMAKHLLKSTDASLKVIATQCGFRNQRRFSEAFRMVEGMSPGQYRKSLWT